MSGAALVAEITSHAYDYDELGRRVKNTFQDGSYWQYGYNDRSEVETATRKTAGGTIIAPLGASYFYDGIGNRLTSNSPVLGDRTYTPNALNQYATITTGDSRTAVGRAPASWNVQVAGVNADRIGEIFHRTLTAANALAPVWQDVVIQRDTGTPTSTQHFWYPAQTLVPTHDFDGNLTADGRWIYTWDAEQCDRRGSILDGGRAGARRVHLPMPRQMNQNRLIEMETTGQATSAGHPATKLRFIYDWQGRRIARHVWQNGNFKSSHRWLYDGWNIVAQFTSMSTTGPTMLRSAVFTWGLDLSGTLEGAGGVGGLLVQSNGAGTVIERASYDGNGNITAWTNSTATAPTSRREYDAFGNTLVSEGAAPSAFGFSTKMQDVETGLYYYGYRFYDPVTGRWPSRDPIEEEGGVNLYGFVRNDGINDWDLLGMVNTRENRDEGSKSFDPMGDFGKKLRDVADKCCKCPKAYKDSTKLANKVKAIWENYYGRGKHKSSRDPVGGYYCFHWAKAFADGIKKAVEGDCWSTELKWASETYYSKKDGKMVEGVKVHFYVVIKASGKNGVNSDSCKIIIDDGYLDKSFVHDPKSYGEYGNKEKRVWVEHDNGDEMFDLYNKDEKEWYPPILF